MNLLKIFDKTIRGWTYNSILLHFCKLQQHVFFYFKALILELQNIFLLVKFFNWISCNKSLNAKISCFSLCFFCLIPLGLECSRSRKTVLFLMSHRLKKNKNLDPQSFTNGAKTWYMLKTANFWRYIASFFSVIWLRWKQSVCPITVLF